MQKRKKQLLGIAGLIVVGVLTAIACAIPETASAAAENGYSVGTDVNVTVLGNKPALYPSSPKDNSTTSSTIVQVSYRYEKMSEIKTTLEYENESGNTVQSVVNTFVPTNQDYGENTFNIDLTTYGLKDREYKLVIKGEGINGEVRTDTILFNYRSVIVEPRPPVDPDEPVDPTDPDKPERYDPIIDIEVSEEVIDVLIHVYYDNSDRPAFVDKDGNEVTILVDRDDIDPETGKIPVKLPFAKYNLPAGWYVVATIGRNQDGRTVSLVTTRIWYDPGASVPTNPTDPTDPTDPSNPNNPDTPETPNTGSILSNLNITRADYLITGLAVFAAVAGFALYLINRKSRR